ncbi:unnamed protein product [Didymodactylos carnosus]|uniref:type I protein arginine methyltransferase n=1 Tax=Didymodactylos carnosus TaxID=1234261 RepID=A0A8S2DTN0_9BILA|nr:unnamed protein product [Didymodactylos carnosus]CAF3799341.1 unnamed protein product [Didymodactylos carnosus]
MLNERNKNRPHEDDDYVLVQQINSNWPKIFETYFLSSTTRLPQSGVDDDLIFYVTRKLQNDFQHPFHLVEVFRYHDSKRLPNLNDVNYDWEETSNLNLVLHQFEYTVTCAVCTKTSNKHLQILKRLSTTFFEMVVNEGQMVCVELLATNPALSQPRVLFLGSIKYEALKKVYETRATTSTRVAQRMSFGIYSKRRVEFVRMRGPNGKGHAEMAVSRCRTMQSGLTTPDSMPSTPMSTSFDEEGFNQRGSSAGLNRWMPANFKQSQSTATTPIVESADIHQELTDGTSSFIGRTFSNAMSWVRGSSRLQQPIGLQLNTCLTYITLPCQIIVKDYPLFHSPKSNVINDVDRTYFESYDNFQVHELMLRDRARVSAYYDAMMKNKHLFQDKIVLDVGSGTGILSMFAAKAGAKRVYGVDACPNICKIANELVKYNRLQDVVQIINKQIEHVELDDYVDIIISEWMGFYLLHESMVESIIYARDNFLRPPPSPDIVDDDDEGNLKQSGIIFPSHAYLYCAPFVDDKVRCEKQTMWMDYFDLDLKPLLKYIPNSSLTECVIQTIETQQLVHDQQLIYSIDLKTIKHDDIKQIKSYCEYYIEEDCIISGFAFWFDCYFSSNNSNILHSVVLSTSPSAQKTHWQQTLVFLKENIYPVNGDVIPVHVKLKQEKQNHRHYKLSLVLKEIKNTKKYSKDDDSTSAASISGNMSDTKKKRRGRRRRRSSTISLTKRVTIIKTTTSSASDSNADDKEQTTTSSSTSTSSDEDNTQTDTHPIPCQCDRVRCKLIKAIIDKYEEENILE